MHIYRCIECVSLFITYIVYIHPIYKYTYIYLTPASPSSSFHLYFYILLFLAFICTPIFPSFYLQDFYMLLKIKA